MRRPLVTFTFFLVLAASGVMLFAVSHKKNVQSEAKVTRNLQDTFGCAGDGGSCGNGKWCCNVFTDICLQGQCRQCSGVACADKCCKKDETCSIKGAGTVCKKICGPGQTECNDACCDADQRCSPTTKLCELKCPWGGTSCGDGDLCCKGNTVCRYGFPSGTPSCDSCPSGQSACGGMNCCGQSERCYQGSCAPKCALGRECGSSCCGSGERCYYPASGEPSCAPTCTSGQQQCGAECCDSQTENCIKGFCEQKAVCPRGQTECGGVCCGAGIICVVPLPGTGGSPYCGGSAAAVCNLPKFNCGFVCCNYGQKCVENRYCR